MSRREGVYAIALGSGACRWNAPIWGWLAGGRKKDPVRKMQSSSAAMLSASRI